jgi:hypothetical protein
MALNFPASPTLDEIYTSDESSWKWDGTTWKSNSFNEQLSLTGNGTSNVTGTFPNFTIISNDEFDGTVTSVGLIVPTGLSVSGSPVTNSGNLTITYSSGYSIPTTSSQNTWNYAVTHSNSAYNQANTATTNSATADQKAVTSGVYANAAFGAANTADQRAVTSGVYANSSYDQANTATTNASTADQKAVSAGSYANSAYLHSNASFIVANTKYSSSGGTISGDVNITGNLNVSGNTITHSADDFIVNDPLILLANNNPGNLLDLGFIAHYIEGDTTKHTGLVRDSSANTYYLFDSYVPHIQETNILDINDATLRITTLKANLVSDSVLVRGYDVVDHTNSAYAQANTSNQTAVTSGVYANASFVVANTSVVNSASASSYANSAYSQANTATTNAATADQKAVTSGDYANSAFATANSKTSNVGTVTSVDGTGTVNGLTLTGTVTTSGNLTLGGTLSDISLTSQVSGTLPVANGGTGITSFGAGVATFLETPSSTNLAAAVTDETGSGALVFGTAPLLTGVRVTLSELGTLTTGTTTIDLATAQVFTATITAANTITVAFSNAPSAGQTQVVLLRLTNAGGGTIVWPAAAKFTGGTAPTLTVSGVDVLGVYYDITTTTYMIFVIGLDVKVP